MDRGRSRQQRLLREGPKATEQPEGSLPGVGGIEGWTTVSEVTIRNTRGSGHQQGWGVGTLEAQHLEQQGTCGLRDVNQQFPS